MSRPRPGLPAAGLLDARERFVGLGALLDLVARLIGTAAGVAKLEAIGALNQPTLTAALLGGETLAQTITKVIELQAAIAALRSNETAMQEKIDEIIQRLQED